MQDVNSLTCPYCQSNDVVYKSKAGEWECQNCDKRFVPPADNSRYLTGKTEHPKAIFFSYGHDDNKELVDDFKRDLEKRGHTVWIDYKEIGTWNDWKGKITQGIHDSELALAFLSKHATREPGVCRNEIAMALNRFGTVYPILLEPVNDVTPPVTISHLQWQDLSQWRDIRKGQDWARWYEEKLIQIITLLEGEASEFEGDINGLREVLKPLSFTSDIARQIPEFIGREWVFNAYQDWLDNQPQSRLFWIKAGPGVGKSAIAAMLAHSHQKAVVGAWFCQANSIERRDPRNALCSIAFQLATRWDDYRRKLRFQLGLNASTQPDDWKGLSETLLKKSEVDLFNCLLAEPLTGLIWREQRLVVVIDALDEASDDYGQNPLVDLLVTRLAHLPSWLNFVVTSRPNPEIVAKLQGFSPFELDTEGKNNRADLQTYLDAGLAKRPDFNTLPEAEQTRIKTILLDNSAGMILYLQQVLKGLEEGALNLSTIEQIPRGLGSLYRIAFDHLYGGDKLQSLYDNEVKPLLRLLLAAPGPLPPALAQQILGWDKETWLRRRNRLGAYVLDTPQGCKLFHKTLSEWLLEERSAPYYLDPHLGKKALAAFLWQNFHDTENEYKPEWPLQTQHWLPSLMPLLLQWEDAAALNRLGRYLKLAYQFAPAEELLRRALVIWEKAHGPEHPDVAIGLTSLAGLLQAQGDYAGAEPMFRRGLAIREKALGPEHPDFVISLNELAGFLYSQRDNAAAELLYRRALVIREKALGLEHPDVATSLNNLAAMLQSRGEYAAAKPLLRRALAISEKILGPEHMDVIAALNNLAILLQAQGDSAGAEPMFRRALAISEIAFGPDHPYVALALGNLAKLLVAQGDSAGVEPMFQRALAIEEKTLGPDHSDAFTCLVALLKNKGDYAAVETLYRRALAISEKILGPEHPDVIAALNNLAILLQAQGDSASAEPMFRRALAISEIAFGPDHPYVALALGNLAKLLVAQGDSAGAEPMFQRALAIREKALGLEHPDVATSLNNLAEALVNRGDLAAAEPLLRRVLAIMEKNYGHEHPDVVISLNNLAKLFKEKGDYGNAEQMFRQGLVIQEQIHGSEHTEVAESLYGLAEMLYLQCDYAAAEPLFRRLLSLSEKNFGLGHKKVIELKRFIARCLREQGKYGAARELFENVVELLRVEVLQRPIVFKPFDILSAQYELGDLYKKSGDLVSARAVLSDALAKAAASLGEENQITKRISNELNSFGGA